MSRLSQLIPFTLSSLPFLTHTPLLIYLKVAKMVNTAEGLMLPLHTHIHTHTHAHVFIRSGVRIDTLLCWRT